MKRCLFVVFICVFGFAPIVRAKIIFDIDYSLDQANNNFFNPNTADGQAARAAMTAAAQVYGDRLIDNLTAITSGGINTWTTDFTNPGNGQNHVAISNLTIPANTIKIYVGGRSLGGAIGLGGPGGFTNGIGDSAFQSALQWRGQTGAMTASPTDFGPWGGTISFDNSVAWNFSLTGPVAGKNDFLTAATHEIAHVLGFGTAPSWKTRLTATVTPFGQLQYVGPFTGPKSEALYGGPVPLEVPPAQQSASDPVINAAHFNNNTQSTFGGHPQETIMDPDITIGSRKGVTLLDWAALDDIGWDLAKPGDANADGTVDFTDLVAVAQNYGTTSPLLRWSQGDFNYDGTVDFQDLVAIAQNYGTTGPQASDIPGASAQFDADWQAAEAMVTGVPEPTSLADLVFPAILWGMRRRRIQTKNN
jgi:hypothetical protein